MTVKLKESDRKALNLKPKGVELHRLKFNLAEIYLRSHISNMEIITDSYHRIESEIRRLRRQVVSLTIKLERLSRSKE